MLIGVNIGLNQKKKLSLSNSTYSDPQHTPRANRFQRLDDGNHKILYILMIYVITYKNNFSILFIKE